MNEVEVHIKGMIDQSWSHWFGLDVTYTDHDDTVLTGFVRDQSALLGLLARIDNLGLQLIGLSIKTRTARLHGRCQRCERSNLVGPRSSKSN